MPEFELGQIELAGVVLSEVAHWEEAGDQVFRSTEYDVIVGDPDLRTAIAMFVDASEDYARFLSDSAENSEDLRLALRILRRLVEGYEARNERLAQQPPLVRRLRGRGHDAARGWHHQPAALT